MSDWFTIDQIDKQTSIISEYRHWEEYLNYLERISELPVKRVFPAHHTLDIQPEILIRMRDAFLQLQSQGKLHHGSGTFDYGDWALWV